MKSRELADAVHDNAARPRGVDTARDTAARAWFAVMAIGQGLFVYYIAGFYGQATLSGDFAAWNRHPFVKGHVPGDTVGNLAFAAHVMLAIVITLGGMLQLLPQVRARAAWLHRWNGRAFLSLSVVVSLAGFYMVWLRDGAAGGLSDLGISLNGLLVLVFAALAWRTAYMRDIASHRRWALRTLLAVNGVFLLRLTFSSWALIMQSEPGQSLTYVFEFTAFLLPLAILELYLRSRDGGGPIMRAVAATTVWGATGYMAIGTLAFGLVFVVGILGGGFS